MVCAKARCDEQRAFSFGLLPLPLGERAGVRGDWVIASGDSSIPSFQRKLESRGWCYWNRLRRWFEGFGAASRAAAGYLSLLVQRKVTQRKHPPEPPKTPALLAEAGARPTGPSWPRGRVRASLREPALRAGLIRLRLRCSAAATGTRRQNQHQHHWASLRPTQLRRLYSVDDIRLTNCFGRK